MEVQNATSKEAMRRQFRAYFIVDPGGINESESGIVRVPCNIVNCGQTPAYNLAVFGDILVVSGNPRDFDPSTDGRLGEATAATDIVLGPGRNQWNFAYQPATLLEPHEQAIHDKKSAVVHYGFLEYDDCFGVRHRTNFSFYHWGHELSDEASKRSRFGNSAT